MRWFSGRSEAQAGATSAAVSEYAVMPKALRAAAATLKGRTAVPDAAVARVLITDAFPISAVIVQTEKQKAAAEARAAEEALKNLRPGFRAGDKGIFVGTWQPKDRDGKSLGKTFNVFAAPTDLDPPDTSGKNCRQFVEAAEELGKRRNWHGHDGIQLGSDAALYNALKNGSAVGKWFIPPRDLLHGKDVDGKVVQDKHLYGLQNEGDFKGTFTTEDKSSSNFPDRYWSCTEHRDTSSHVWAVRFSGGDANWFGKDDIRLSCRPCRVELAL